MEVPVAHNSFDACITVTTTPRDTVEKIVCKALSVFFLFFFRRCKGSCRPANPSCAVCHCACHAVSVDTACVTGVGRCASNCYTLRLLVNGGYRRPFSCDFANTIATHGPQGLATLHCGLGGHAGCQPRKPMALPPLTSSPSPPLPTPPQEKTKSISPLSHYDAYSLLPSLARSAAQR